MLRTAIKVLLRTTIKAPSDNCNGKIFATRKKAKMPNLYSAAFRCDLVEIMLIDR